MKYINGPLFIIFEGIDGAGKSTLVSKLSDTFVNSGVDVTSLFEPTNGTYGKKIRSLLRGDCEPDKMLLTELFIKDRLSDVRENITPALERGRIVLLDRYYYSNAAYQASNIMESEKIIQENRSHGIPEPDIIYFIDITPKTALERIGKREEIARECFEEKTRLQKIYQLYTEILPKTAVFIDGTLHPDNIVEYIITDLNRFFV